MDNAVITLTVTPSVNQGDTLVWSLWPGLIAPRPWRITPELSTDGSTWSALPDVDATQSAVTITPPTVNKDTQLRYRVVLTAANGAVYESAPVTRCGALSRNRWILLKELLRRERLFARANSTGRAATLYVRALAGPKCSVCIDPILGVSRLGGDCPRCGGLTFDPPFIGPLEIAVTTSTRTKRSQNAEDGVGIVRAGTHSFRVAGAHWITTQDVIALDGKLYNVEAAENAAEVDTLPVVQMAVVNELPTASPLYGLECFKS